MHRKIKTLQALGLGRVLRHNIKGMSLKVFKKINELGFVKK